ncbi:MAG: 30S ribosomal protein S17 [Candidatus Omnitrophica bacterium]|nr:30S ribosomal protein S17 [Candidatus Omnitrophota bacterium]
MKVKTAPATQTTVLPARPHPREREGVVVSDKMSKTVVVEVLRVSPHPVYGKVVKKKIRYKAHNEGDKAKAGNLVRIMETRPLSKEKRWTVVEVLK